MLFLTHRPLWRKRATSRCSMTLSCILPLVDCQPATCPSHTTPNRTLQQYGIDMESMFALLEQQPEVTDAPGARPLALEWPARPPSLAFDGVWFRYSADGQPVLRDVTWSAPGGATVALVGATGSGKSSCLRLLYRFYDPFRGRVLVGGQAAADVTQASLRQAIGIVPQDVVLFNDTVKYNIG